MTPKEIFKELYKDEFDDPSEAFLLFLLSLIDEVKILQILDEDNDLYYRFLDSILNV